MSMAFFSLSIGMGSLMVYGSYLPDDTSIFQVSSAVAFFDTFVVLAGVIIFPIVFTYNLDPSSAGPGLIFQTLPIAFGSMDFGTIISTSFSFIFCSNNVFDIINRTCYNFRNRKILISRTQATTYLVFSHGYSAIYCIVIQ